MTMLAKGYLKYCIKFFINEFAKNDTAVYMVLKELSFEPATNSGLYWQNIFENKYFHHLVL